MVVTKKTFFYKIYEPDAWLIDEVIIKLTESLLNSILFLYICSLLAYVFISYTTFAGD